MTSASPVRASIVRALRRTKLAVVATLGAEVSGPGKGGPQAAVVGVAVTDELEIVFDTLESTRKVRNLRADARAALVMWWDDAVTAQIEGQVDFPTGEDLERLKRAYFEVYPDGRERLAWSGILHARVRPTWVRITDFSKSPPRIDEFRPG